MMKFLKFCPLFFIIPFCALFAMDSNPFAFDVIPQEFLSDDDYEELQEKLRSLELVPFIQSLYPQESGFVYLGDFVNRCTQGVRETLIDRKKGYFPILKLEKIGTGGNCCFVTSETYKNAPLVNAQIEALRKSGYNGYYLYLIGGYPNPTGKEITYAALPYSRKIFMMLEAFKKGFNKVIWINSGLQPIRDPALLFEWLDMSGAFLHAWKTPTDSWKLIFPQIKDQLQRMTGTNVLRSRYISTMIFGLKMDTELAKWFLQMYYQMADMGTPFLSCSPDEFVLTAIIGRKEFSEWHTQPFDRLLRGIEGGRNPQDLIEEYKKLGYFFFHKTN